MISIREDKQRQALIKVLDEYREFNIDIGQENKGRIVVSALNVTEKVVKQTIISGEGVPLEREYA
jgi:hypothetical protein